MNLKYEVLRYSNLNGYPIEDYNDLKCTCGSSEFELYSDDEEGGAFVTCKSCGAELDIENSKQNIGECFQNGCNCDNGYFNVGVGKAFHQDTNDVRWVYVGAHCSKCSLSGVYVDWKEC